MQFTRLGRVIQISHTVLYFRLYTLIPQKFIPWYLKFFLVLFFWYPNAPKNQSSAKNLRLALEQLGPVWIKFGQMLSTRKDLLTPELSQELTHLQDNVSPFSSEAATQLITSELNIDNIDDLFSNFEQTPIATASIAQVHGAELEIEGETKAVVIKIVRPNIEKQINADVNLMLMIAKLVAKHMSEGYRFRPVEVVQEYKTTIINELNLTIEAANGIRLKENFLDSDDLYIPKIYQEFNTANVLVMERIDGIPVSDIQQLHAQGSDLKKLAERGVRLFFTQVFRDSFFHADMHPGNIFISKQNPSDPQYIGIDFGIMGTLNAEDKRYLAENFVAFFNRDYLKVAQLHVQSGWVPSHVNVEQFEIAIRTVCDPIFNKPLEEISFAQVLIGLFDTARQFEMQVQPQLVLLQKTLLYVEGLGRQLYPQLDLWQTAKPFLENWVKEQMGFKAFLKSSKQNLPYWLEQAPQIPELFHNGLQTINKLPEYKQELIDEYKQLQANNQQFFLHLALLSTSVISFLLILLLAEPNSMTWKIGVTLTSLQAFYSAIKLFFRH